MLAVDLLGNYVPGPYGWYTFENGGWRKLPNSIVPRGPVGEVVAVGEFPTLPANLIVLAETS